VGESIQSTLRTSGMSVGSESFRLGKSQEIYKGE
jgi:hypothetical protein